MTILVKDANSSSHDILWQNKASGSSINMNWTYMEFDMSTFSDTFTLIIGNDDESQYCDNSDHGWSIWADDVELFKATWQTDNNNTLDFSGYNDYVSISDLIVYNDQNLTVEAWTYSSGVTSKSEIISLGDHVGIRGINWDGKLQAFYHDGSGWPTTATDIAIDNGMWHHVAYVIDGSNNVQTIYVDGEKVATTNHTSNIDWGSLASNTYIGNHANGENFHWDGRIDEVRIWSDVRTATEIRENMCRTLEGDESNLEAYYQFDQSSGTNLPDNSNNSYDGTLTNMDPPTDWVASDAFTTWQGDESSDWGTSGNWSNGLPSSIDNVGVYKWDGLNEVTISGSPTISNVLVMSSTANPTVNSNITIDSSLFLLSTLDMANHVLTLQDNSHVFPDGGASNQYITGQVKKIGDDAFTFPLGDDGQWARLAISAPSSTTDAFTAAYQNYAYSNTSSLGPNLNNVSEVEHWTLNRTNGSSNVDVTLYWEDGSASGIDDLTDLKIAHWNSGNTEWESLGNSSTTGNTTAGTITVANVSNFSPFTFGSGSSSANLLPIELLSFSATQDQGEVLLRWNTASEQQNSHFIVQKRTNANWENIGRVEGNGTTFQQQHYRFIDPDFEAGTTQYYRLKQVDYNGHFEYSEVRTVSKTQNRLELVSLYPNPVKSQLQLKVESSIAQNYQLTISNIYGQQVYTTEIMGKKDGLAKNIPVRNLPPGHYVLSLSGDQTSYQTKFVKSE